MAESLKVMESQYGVGLGVQTMRGWFKTSATSFAKYGIYPGQGLKAILTSSLLELDELVAVIGEEHAKMPVCCCDFCKFRHVPGDVSARSSHRRVVQGTQCWCPKLLPCCRSCHRTHLNDFGTRRSNNRDPVRLLGKKDEFCRDFVSMSTDAAQKPSADFHVPQLGLL